MSEADLQAHRDELVQKLDVITRELLSFKATVTVLTGDLATEKKRSRRERLVLRVAVGGLILDLVLSVLVGVGYLRQAQTSKQQGEIVAQQENTRSDVLCPLFAIFIGAYDPTSRTEGYAREAYEETYRKLRKINNEVLRCNEAPVPPRTKPIGLGPDILFPAPTPVALGVPILVHDLPVVNQRPGGTPRVTIKPGRVTLRSGSTVKSSGRSTTRSVTGTASKPLASTTKAVTGAVSKTTKAVGDTVKKTTKSVSKTVGSVVKGLGLK